MPSVEQLTNRDFREKLLQAVRDEGISKSGMDEYLYIPKTDERRIHFNGHVKLTPLGKKKFRPSVTDPSKQIICHDLSNLKMDAPCPVGISRNFEVYKNFALNQLKEFMSELGLHH